MFPDLENADSPLENPDAGRRWTGQRIALVFGGLLAAVTASWAWAIQHDSPLEPWEDPESAAVAFKPTPGPAENGYLFLKGKWERVLESEGRDFGKAVKLIRGIWPWDEELAGSILENRPALHQDLRTALGMPHWQEASRGGGQEWLTFLANALHLEAMAAFKSGDLNRAVDLLADVQRLGTRILTSTGFDLTWTDGIGIRELTAACCCDMLSSGKVDAGALPRFSSMWEGEPLNRDLVAGRFLKIISFGRRDIVGEGGAVDVLLSYDRFPKIRRLMFKPNRTANRYQATARLILRNLEALPENLEGAIADMNWRETPSSTEDEWLGIFQPGLTVERMGVGELINFRNMTVPMEPFINRAMRVRLALYRWQQDHAGALPEKLTELVPYYLPSLPADPWSGLPLLWDPKRDGVIFAVGCDGLGDLPLFPPGTWISRSATCPGLRLTAPPAPLPAKPVTKLAKSAAKPKKATPAAKPAPSAGVAPAPVSSPAPAAAQSLSSPPSLAVPGPAAAGGESGKETGQ